MARIFLAAADSPVDRADLERSVANPIDRQLVIRHFSDGSYPELLEIERRGHGFYAWGLPASAPLVEQWFLMGVGDFLLVGQRGSFRFYARVLGRYDNERAARAIWGPASADADLRQYLFFLSEPMTLAIPYRTLAEWLPAPDGPCDPVPDERVAQLVGEFGSVERFARKRLLNVDAGGPLLDISGMIRVSERDLARLQAFDAPDSKAGRQAVVESIIKRRGQPGLRHALLAAYEGRCAITSCNGPRRPGGGLHRAIPRPRDAPAAQWAAAAGRSAHALRPWQDRHRHRYDDGAGGRRPPRDDLQAVGGPAAATARGGRRPAGPRGARPAPPARRALTRHALATDMRGRPGGTTPGAHARN
jgi:hypothetical protein